MGVLRSSNKIDERTDFIYNGPDYRNFPACSLCLNYSPFLFYVTSFNAMASYKGIVHPKLNIFCVECLPQESAHNKTADRPFYKMECLFNSPEIVSLFRGYRYTNPFYFMYSGVDRIIITENAKISPSYKELMRKPFPRTVKMQKLAQLFDPVHRMRFERHSDLVAVFRALRAKHLEILQFYENANTADLHDNYDVLANRSPFDVSRRVERRIPSDDSSSDVNSTVIAQERNDLEQSEYSRAMARTQESTESNINSQPIQPNISLQSVSSTIDNSNEVMAGTQGSTESNTNSQPIQLNISSQSVSSNINNSNEVMAGTQGSTESNTNSQPIQPNISSQSVSSPIDKSNEMMAGTQQSAESNTNSQPIQLNISSQSASSMGGIPSLSESIDDELPAQMALSMIREPSVSSTSSSVSDISVRRRVVVPQRKGRVVYHDSQEAGPSGLQQQQQQQQQQQKGGNAEPKSKRRRTMQPPTNPSPTDFPLTLQGPTNRYPRLHGG